MLKANSSPVVRVLLIAAGLCCTSLVQAASVTAVEVRKNGKPVVQGAGTIVSGEQILLSYDMAQLGDQFIVKDPNTGADVVASKVAESENADLALLSVPGLGGEPILISKQASGTGRNVALVLPDGEKREGTLHSFPATDRKNPLARVQHTALFGSGEFSAPLLNNCGELLGISQSETRGLLNRELVPPTEFGVAGALEPLKAFLTGNSVAFEEAAEICLSVDEQLESKGKEVGELKKEQEELEAEKARIEEEKAEIEKQKSELEELSQTQKEDLETKEEDLKKQEEELEEQRKKLEKEIKDKEEALAKRKAAEEEAARKKKEQLYLIGGGSIVLLGLLLILLRRRRQLSLAEQHIESSQQELSREKERAQAVEEELQQSKATFQDFLLVGTDEAGKEHRVKIIGNALVRSEHGQVVGRSARDADYVLNVEQVSRKHLRLSIADGQVFAEDLESYNGTAINGQALKPGDPRPLNDNDELRVATINMRVFFTD